MIMQYSAVIVAAGSGQRMKLGYNKVFHQIDHRTILDITIQAFRSDDDCQQIIVVTNPENAALVPCDVECVNGGELRSHSVINGLKLVKYPYVMIHDGARPNLSLQSINDLKTALLTHEACLLMVPCKDTIKIVKDGFVKETLDRSVLYQAQTPQAFKTELIDAAYQLIQEGENYTDDASVLEKHLGIHSYCVIGDYDNIKVTTQEDLKLIKV